MAREINLVPDIKEEMIHALKMRNLIFFICIVVAAVAFGVIAIFGSIAGGQAIALNDKTNMLDKMSNVINDYKDLGDFLTIQGQVNGLAEISDNKNVLSRLFNFILALEPTNGDTIEISKLTVDLTDSSILFEAQADAKTDPGIDYNVLDAFKKSMSYMTYDYGSYIDANDEVIPAYCIIEKDLNGVFYAEGNDLYAFWTINKEGCNPSAKNEGEQYNYQTEYNDEAGDEVVKIWRTPRFNEWHDAGFMETDGVISGVPHFESECTQYFGVKNEDGSLGWAAKNDSCALIRDGEAGIDIIESSNGIDSSGDLVLRFSANLYFDPEAFRFANTHLIALGPTGRYNVTDSYTQLQNMFTERAADIDGKEGTR